MISFVVVQNNVRLLVCLQIEKLFIILLVSGSACLGGTDQRGQVVAGKQSVLKDVMLAKMPDLDWIVFPW